MSGNTTLKNYKCNIEHWNTGQHQEIYHIEFINKQPRIDELEDLLLELDYLYQAEIKIKGNKVIYTGYTD